MKEAEIKKKEKKEKEKNSQVENSAIGLSKNRKIKAVSLLPFK